MFNFSVTCLLPTNLLGNWPNCLLFWKKVWIRSIELACYHKPEIIYEIILHDSNQLEYILVEVMDRNTSQLTADFKFLLTSMYL
jgi:hypothetical protein